MKYHLLFFRICHKKKSAMPPKQNQQKDEVSDSLMRILLLPNLQSPLFIHSLLAE